MDLGLVQAAVSHIVEDGHAALVLKDRHETGYDYLVVTGKNRIDPVTQWWFDELKVAVRVEHSLEDDEHPEHTVRVGLCSPGRRSAGVAARIREAFAERAVLHYFPAVTPDGDPENPDDQALILELFDPRVSKWSAVSWLADQRGIGHDRIAAIGDQINDVPMIRSAALGVAMGNAIDEVKGAARRLAPSNGDDGVAYAIERILDGRW